MEEEVEEEDGGTLLFVEDEVEQEEAKPRTRALVAIMMMMVVVVVVVVVVEVKVKVKKSKRGRAKERMMTPIAIILKALPLLRRLIPHHRLQVLWQQTSFSLARLT